MMRSPQNRAQTSLTKAACLSKCFTDDAITPPDCPFKADYLQCLEGNSAKQLSGTCRRAF
ncbi:BQ2448_6004 [Microbotryum intermedium]|uniref:BQ2448_6004 protein n=1 Tax=Microbotryum intermedium TaxID=269621 RepID=A0A238F858_9BASI|nr:BQ2448_6004 [Microbotryum intermedium]